MSNDAWAAGLIEGEGYIGHSQAKHHKTYIQPFVKVQMTDEDVVKRLYEHFGYGSFKKLNMDIPSRQGKKQVWNWTVCSTLEVYDLLSRIRPWLGERRKNKCDEVRLLLEQTSKKVQELYN
jgi:hypothetical protein